MYFIIDTAKIGEVFCFIDDSCKEVAAYFSSHPLPKGLSLRHAAGRKASLSESEVLALYHLSGFKCFEYLYRRLFTRGCCSESYFPKAVSYTQFLPLARQARFHSFLLAQYRCRLSRHTGHYCIDPKELPVCDNRRIHQHCVFGNIAQGGKSSTGWFYGLKLHLVTNQHGQLVHSLITPANVADNSKQVLAYLLPGCYGDKGYLTAMLEELLEEGLHLVSEVRKNMKNMLPTLSDKVKLMGRGTIEAVNDILMGVYDIDHTRRRNPLNALVTILPGLSAHTFLKQKNCKSKAARIND